MMACLRCLRLSRRGESVIDRIAESAGREFMRRHPTANRSINMGNGKWYAKRRLAMSGLRARANLLLDRIQFLGPGAKSAYDRSQSKAQFRSHSFHHHAARARAFETQSNRY